MFLDTSKFKILREADEENKPQDEPTEKDSSMNSEQDENGMGEDPTADMNPDDMGGGSGGEDDMGGGEEGGNDGMGGGDDMSSGDSMSSEENPDELLKKQRLFKDYKRLIDVMNTVMDAFSVISYGELSEDAKKILNFIEQKMNENYDKIVIIASKQFNNLTYRQLMTLYIYLKMSTKDYTGIVKHFIDKQREDEKIK